MMEPWQKVNNIVFKWDREKAIDEGSRTVLTLDLVQIQVALDETNRGEISLMCVLANMAIYAIEMTKLEIKGNLGTLGQGSSQLFS